MDAGRYGLFATAFAAGTLTGATPGPGEEGAMVATASVALVVVAGASKAKGRRLPTACNLPPDVAP